MLDREPAFVLERNAGIPMRDGATLRANVFRPPGEGAFPVLMTFGPYGKDVHMRSSHGPQWDDMARQHPEILASSSCKYLVFETPDPEVWVPFGYAVLKVDSRGAGKSPGKLDVNSPTEFRDFWDAILWAGQQSWCNGKIGLLGISYYAAGQWMLAAERPPYLAAILPWQGTPDFYRDRTGHGGMLCNGFTETWFGRTVLQNQHGNGASSLIDIETGERNTGPALSPETLVENRVDYMEGIRAHRLLDDWYRERSAVLENIELPALVVANWGGLGLHLRGTIDGYRRIASRDKWLKIQSGSYFSTFFMPEGVALQRRFFDHYLKGVDNGWERETRVEVTVRAPGDGVHRTIAADEWPLPETHFTRYYLDADHRTLGTKPPSNSSSASYDAFGQGLTFTTGPLTEPLEFAGPLKLRIWVSSSTDDIDIFATVRAFDAAGIEQTFFAATESLSPVSQGWLRASHRKLDPLRTTEDQPYHSHDELQLLVPGEQYMLDVEVWPASMYLPPGYRLDLTIEGKDFERPGSVGERKGSGPFIHTDPVDRNPERYGGRNTLHFGGKNAPYLLLPVLRNSAGPTSTLPPTASS
jgi:predicted acyl esterase